jgi:hypothetical protein
MNLIMSTKNINKSNEMLMFYEEHLLEVQFT